MIIRPARPADAAAIAAVQDAAFAGPAESAIVAGVRAAGAVVAELVAEEAGAVVGAILFSRMGTDRPGLFAGLGPVGVLPGRQGAGFGAALCEAGIAACRNAGVKAVVVLGHPAYYPRFGFSAEAARTIASPYAGRPAFMALALETGALDAPGRLDYPAAFG